MAFRGFVNVVVSAAAFAAMAGDARAASVDEVTLRSPRYPIDDFYVCAIAKFAFGQRIAIEKGQSISERIRRECGHEDNSYGIIFRSIRSNKENVELRDNLMFAKNDASFIFPACLKARVFERGLDAEPPSYALTDDMAISQIVTDVMGYAKGTRDYEENVVAIHRDNPDALPGGRAGNVQPKSFQRIETTTIAKGQTIKLKTVLEPTPLKLDLSRITRAEFLAQMLANKTRESFKSWSACGTQETFGVPLEPADQRTPIVAAEPQALERAPPRFVMHGGRRLEALVRGAAPEELALAAARSKSKPPHAMGYCSERNVEPLDQGANACDGTVSDAYPVNWLNVKEAIALEELHRAPDETVPTVVIADTGLVGFDGVIAADTATYPKQFPAKFFLRVKPGDLDHDTIALKLSEEGDARYLPPFTVAYSGGDNDHGTHVAGIMLGQGDAEIRENVLKNRIRLLVVNLLSKPKVDGDLCLRNAHIAAKDIETAISRASDLAAVVAPSLIFNMSLETYEKIGANPENLLKNHLVVAAAGNSGHNYNEDETQPEPKVWPAAWGRDIDDNVLTAGGHDARRTAVIGNSGQWHADVLAPACKIRSFVDLEAFGEKSGTSQAAAFVSMAAALIKKHHKEWTPRRIKNRLIAASDFVASLSDKSRSGGVLNIGASIAAHFDVIKLRSGNAMHFGWLRTNRVWSCGPRVAERVLVTGETSPVGRVSYVVEKGGTLPARIEVLRTPHHERRTCAVSDEMKGELQDGDHIEFERVFVVQENGENVKKTELITVPYSDIQEIVPTPYSVRPPV